MRLLYIDIDSLRADHLGCYGYHRDTSPVIDRLAERGVRFERCYASDVPCLPSRTALISGRFGIHTGVVTHGGTMAEPINEGPSRRFQSTLGATSWTRRMRRAGMHAVSISTFAERHSAFWWTSGFHEVHNVGLMGLERADEVVPVALDWLARHGRDDRWFLHVNLWDPHTPYRTPPEWGDPFAREPTPRWLTDAVREDHWSRPGPHSAQEMNGFTAAGAFGNRFPRQPTCAPSMDDVRRMFDGYDAGVRFADEHIGLILERLAELGVLDETAILVSADHGENLGELNVYGDHHTADEPTGRLPAILVWPGLSSGRTDTAFHYQVDIAATILDLLGCGVPGVWDGRSFADALREGARAGRDHVVVSQAAWAVQRSVRFEDWLFVRTYHDAFHGWPEAMLFDLAEDPYEQHDLRAARPEVAARADALLDAWHTEQMRRSPHDVDPFDVVLQEGGGWHVRGHLEDYLARLRETGRGKWAEWITANRPIHETGRIG